jgi:hypothetical protein
MKTEIDEILVSQLKQLHRYILKIESDDIYTALSSQDNPIAHKAKLLLEMILKDIEGE